MLLGLHTYSLHLHGMGQNWGGFKLQWEPVWDIFSLMDEANKLGLDGLHLTAADLGSTDRDHLRTVRRAAEERNLFLEDNFSLDASEYDDRLTNTIRVRFMSTREQLMDGGSESVMGNISNSIKKLGFDQSYLDLSTPERLEGFEIARVVAVHKDSYVISDGENDVLAELVGKLLYSAASPIDYPTVGDWVVVNFFDDKTFAIIHEILPRKSLLKRKTPGKKIEFQLIAANIDVAFIVQSLDTNFSLNRLERYLVMSNASNIKPIVLLSKSDLLASEEVAARIAEIRNIMPDLAVQSFSSKNESGLKNIKDLLNPGLTYCLLGSSGVCGFEGSRRRPIIREKIRQLHKNEQGIRLS